MTPGRFKNLNFGQNVLAELQRYLLFPELGGQQAI